MSAAKKPKLAVFKFASCDGCQLSLLNCEDELLEIAGAVDIVYFPEATSVTGRGGYDIALVEGSITTSADEARIQSVRRKSRVLVAMGACATGGGIQSLRNWADLRTYQRSVYPNPQWLDSLPQSTPIRNHVYVDYELRGCPISKSQLLQLLCSLLVGGKPQLPDGAVCMECKRAGLPCLMVLKGKPCMGPVTQAGCGALCPSFDRGCYGCYGPCESGNAEALARRFSELGMSAEDQTRAFRSFNACSEPFRTQGRARSS